MADPFAPAPARRRVITDIVGQYPRVGERLLRAEQIVSDYQNLAYDAERHAHVKWMGHEVWKDPNDLLIYAEVIHEVRPALLVELGSFLGGSALFFAHMMDLVGCDGEVISIDVRPDDPAMPRPTHERVHWLQGSSVDPEVVAAVGLHVKFCDGPVMVCLDSNHERDHVAAELEAYHRFVTPGSYLVVEDTHLNGHPVLPGFGPGPMEALVDWIVDHPEFVPDTRCERLLVTANPGGWLRRLP